MKQGIGTILGRSVIRLLLISMAVLTLTPLIWLAAAAFKGPDDMFHYMFFSPHFTLFNFQELFKLPFLRYMINSFFVTSTTVLVQLFFSSLAGFALAKYEFKGKKYVMILMLATLMIPGQVVMAPLYEQIYRLGLVDSYPGLIIPGAVSV